jgi:hypothetical protein
MPYVLCNILSYCIIWYLYLITSALQYITYITKILTWLIFHLLGCFVQNFKISSQSSVFSFLICVLGIQLGVFLCSDVI